VANYPDQGLTSLQHMLSIPLCFASAQRFSCSVALNINEDEEMEKPVINQRAEADFWGLESNMAAGALLRS